MLSHGDRGLGNFQGAGATEMAGIKTLVEHDTIAGRAAALRPSLRLLPALAPRGPPDHGHGRSW